MGDEDEPPPQYQPSPWYGYSPYYPPPQYTDQPGVALEQSFTNPSNVAPGPMRMDEPPPPDYMNRAIFVTICCFWPTGVFAIMKASESRSAIARGDMESARSSSSTARQLSNISVIACVASLLVGMLIAGLYWFIGVIPNMSSGPSEYLD